MAKKNSGPAMRVVKPTPLPRVKGDTMGIVTHESPKNTWKPNAGGRK